MLNTRNYSYKGQLLQVGLFQRGSTLQRSKDKYYIEISPCVIQGCICQGTHSSIAGWYSHRLILSSLCPRSNPNSLRSAGVTFDFLYVTGLHSTRILEFQNTRTVFQQRRTGDSHTSHTIYFSKKDGHMQATRFIYYTAFQYKIPDLVTTRSAISHYLHLVIFIEHQDAEVQGVAFDLPDVLQGVGQVPAPVLVSEGPGGVVLHLHFISWGEPERGVFLMFSGVENIKDTSITTTNKMHSLVILRPVITTFHHLLLVCQSQANTTISIPHHPDPNPPPRDWDCGGDQCKSTITIQILLLLLCTVLLTSLPLLSNWKYYLRHISLLNLKSTGSCGFSISATTPTVSFFTSFPLPHSFLSSWRLFSTASTTLFPIHTTSLLSFSTSAFDLSASLSVTLFTIAGIISLGGPSFSNLYSFPSSPLSLVPGSLIISTYSCLSISTNLRIWSQHLMTSSSILEHLSPFSTIFWMTLPASVTSMQSSWILEYSQLSLPQMGDGWGHEGLMQSLEASCPFQHLTDGRFSMTHYYYMVLTREYPSDRETRCRNPVQNAS